jgi:hypothetical protein
MRIERIILGRSVRFVDFVHKSDKPLPPGRITRAIQARYDFVQVPTTLQDYNFQTGVSFLGGYFQDIAIDRFQIFERGMVCEAQASTDLCDAFLDDLNVWFGQEFQRPSKEDIPVVRIYASNLELHSDVRLGDAMRTFSPVGQAIWAALNSYGQPAMFEISGIKLHTDPTQLPAIKPLEFIFERRADKPYFANIYFSAAPLRTVDHMKILEVLEATILSKVGLPT